MIYFYVLIQLIVPFEELHIHGNTSEWKWSEWKSLFNRTVPPSDGTDDGTTARGVNLPVSKKKAVAIIGTGMTLNNVTKEIWSVMEKHIDTFAINHIGLHRYIRPTFWSLEVTMALTP